MKDTQPLYFYPHRALSIQNNQTGKQRCANKKGEENEPQSGRMVSIYYPKSPQKEQTKTLDLFNFTE